MISADATSYGGGVQSTALLVLAATGRFKCSTFVFANVGHDSENPATVDYVRDIATPYAAKHSIKLVEVERPTWPTGDPHTLLSHLLAYNGCQACGAGPDDECYPACPSTVNTGGDLPIPVKITPSGAPVARSCTKHWKIVPVTRWLIEHRGASAEIPLDVALGISVDEIERAKPGIDPRVPTQRRVFPLLDLGLHRNDCRRIIAEAGLPIPAKSTCWFCPFHSARQWAEIRRDDPDRFDAAADLEVDLNVQRHRRKLGPVFLTSTLKPLSLIHEAQEALPLGDDLGCDSGWCMT